MIDDLLLRHLAATQHGLVTVAQADALGIDHRARTLLVDDRRWSRSAPLVLRLVGSPITRAQRTMAAVLDGGPGAALNKTSSCAWWRVPGNLLEPFHIATVRGHVNRAGRASALHEPVLLPPHHVVTLDGIPTVVPARALFEVAGMRRRGAKDPTWVRRMERMVDSAWAMRLVSGRTLRRMLEDLAQRGRPGIRVMRQVLATRPDDYVPPASGLESRVAQILDRAELPPFRRQVDLGDDEGWIGRVDFRGEHAPVVLEIQSERFHASRIDQQLDANRIARLERSGLEVVELTETDVWHRPQVVVDKVSGAIERARPRSLSPPALDIANPWTF